MKESEEPSDVTKDKSEYSTIVIGGGPAGLATSLTLSARGVRHCIIEAEANSILKPGEALPPNARPLLRQLGIEALLQHKSHHPYYGNKSRWGNDEVHQETFIRDVHGHGYLIDRMHFEGQLRALVQNAEHCTFYEGYRLQKVSLSEQEVSIEISNHSENQQLTGAYIVDATGRKSSVCRQLGIRKQQLDEQFAIVTRADLSTSVEQQIYIDTTEKGWWYAAPIGTAQLSLMFFTSKELLPKREEVFNFLDREKKASPVLNRLLNGAKISQDDFQIMPSGTTCLAEPYGQRWVAVGDAAYSYDPISSYGITSALAGGYYAGQALADSLEGKEEALSVYHYLMEKAFQAYLQKLSIHYRQETRWKESIYWKRKVAEMI